MSGRDPKEALTAWSPNISAASAIPAIGGQHTLRRFMTAYRQPGRWPAPARAVGRAAARARLASGDFPTPARSFCTTSMAGSIAPERGVYRLTDAGPRPR